MRRMVGSVLLGLALLGLIGVVKQFARADSTRPVGQSAYQGGRTAGKYTAVVIVLVLGVTGLTLLLSQRPGRSAAAPGKTPPSKSWYRTTGGIVGLSVAGSAVALIIVGILIRVAGGILHRRHTAPTPPDNYSETSSAPARRSAGEPAQTGPFHVGGSAEAHWAGRWIPGKITRINPGGFSVMVQLEDARFPHPIVLSTNALRVK